MKLFGTDGIRGEAGVFPLDAETLERVCRAAGGRFARAGGGEILVARDTRLSGPWIRDIAAAAFRRSGLAVVDAGVLTTPAAVYVAARRGCIGALVISASHNPFHDNGLKFIGPDGGKLPDEEEAAIEAEVAGPAPAASDRRPAFAADPRTDFQADEESLAVYTRAVAEAFPRLREKSGSFSLVVDTAHGAGTPLSAWAAGAFGFPVHRLFHQPDGVNINQGCGAVHPGALAEGARRLGVAFGMALDGDGDRIVVCDGAGRVLDGDAILWILARRLAREGRLAGGTVVGTVMTNMGLEKALAREGIRLERTPVGDRHIQARLREGGFALGGEPSGHVILRAHTLTGDGFYVGCALADLLLATDRTLPELAAGYEPFPSRLFNLRLAERVPLGEIPELAEIDGLVARLAPESGRTVIRYSGTEPLLRIFVEAEDLEALLPGLEPLVERIRASRS